MAEAEGGDVLVRRLSRLDVEQPERVMRVTRLLAEDLALLAGLGLDEVGVPSP